MSGAWRMALRNLSRNRRRNLATGFAIALGFAGLVLFGGYRTRVVGYLRTNTVYLAHLGHVVIYKQGGLDGHQTRPRKFSLTREEQEAIVAAARAEPEVEIVERALDGTGLAGNGCKTVPFIARGVEADVDKRLREHPVVRRWAPDLVAPRHGVNLGDAPGVAGAMLLSEGLARRLGKTKVHGELPAAGAAMALDCASPDAARLIAADANVQLAGVAFDGRFSAVDGEVVGIYTTNQVALDEAAILTTLAELQQLYDTDRVTQISLYLGDPDQAGAVAARLETALAAKGVEVDAFTFDDERANGYYTGTIEIIGAMVGFITMVVLAVVVLSILNSMTMTILERTREIGNLRSIGFTRRDVAFLFMREGLILTAIALAAGLALGLAAAEGVNAAHVTFQPPGVPHPIQLLFTPTVSLCASLAGGMLLLGGLAAWLATRSRTRMRIADLNTATTS